MTAPDSQTVRPSSAELWIAYHRKILLALAPVLLAGFVVIRDAFDAGVPVTAITWTTAGLAVAGALGTYLPGNAIAKLVASGAAAITSGVLAAASDGLTYATGLTVLTQMLAWIAAGAIANGAAPGVVIAAAANVRLDGESPQ